MAKLEQLLEQVRKDRDVRRNLIEIRQNISDESLRRQFLSLLEGDYSLLTGLLDHEDPKVRRNAARILGMTGDDTVLPALFDAWEREETLFVRSDYLKAAGNMDYREYLPRLRERILELSERMEHKPENVRDAAEDRFEESSGSEDRPQEHAEESAEEKPEGRAEDRSEDRSEGRSADRSADRSEENPLWENDRHLLSELSALRRMTARFEMHGKHHFSKMNPAPELLLRTNVLHADVTARQVTCGAVHAMRGSVHVKGGDLNEILKIRTWVECLFPIPGAKPIRGDEKMIASKLRDLKIGNYLNYLHEDNGEPYRYRIELKNSSVPGEKRGEYIRRIASWLDVLEKGRLLNNESDYEVELRLIERKDHSLIPMLKLYTLPDTRFAWRKETTAQSTSAPLAALAVSLASPFLRKDAQILDPFCGTGTLLIERCLAVPADPVYGVDHFGEAIEKARVNAEAAQPMLQAPIHYINRDFFDFTHAYPFDEIITFLPDSQAGEEQSFAGEFLEKSCSLLADEAVLIVLTNAPDALKKAAALQEGCSVREAFLLNERTGCAVVIVRYQRLL